MRMSILLAFIAALTATVTVTAPAYAADTASCHFAPVAESSAVLQPTQSVGVLYSEGTVATLQYLEQYHSMAQNGAKDAGLDSRIRDALVNSSDPKLAIDHLIGSLQQQFASVTVYASLDELVQAKPDVVVMLDTFNRLVTQRNNQVEARFVATFYDANLQYIGKAEGAVDKQMPSVWVHDKKAPEIAAQIDQQRVLQLDALKQFDHSLKTLVTAGDKDRVASN